MKIFNQYKRNSSGFSLLEILAVLFIIGIILTISLPAIGPMVKTRKLKGAAENLAGTLEYARQYAGTTNIDCYVVFPIGIGSNIDNRAYKLYSYNGSVGNTVGKWEMLPVGVEIDTDPAKSTFISSARTIDIPFPEDSDVTNQKTLNYVKFIPAGRSDVNRSIQITDQQSGAFTGVTFYNYPGAVRVWDLDG